MEHQKAIVEALRAAQQKLTRVQLAMLLYAVQALCDYMRREMEA
jgi:hypothetical protein